MSPALQDFIERLKNTWSSVSFSQRMFIGVLATILIAVFIGAMVWMGRPEFSLLYANLQPEDANRVVKILEKQQIPFVLEQNGTAIMVPADKVHGLRISIAGENVLTGTGIGFEIFNDVQVGQTDFVQRLNYRRALEGELGRTISQFPGVESARVHLVLPHRSLFIEEQQKPSAAVLLKLTGSRRVEPRDMEALVNLVTMSVEGLDRTRVSVTDNSGKVLFQPEVEGSISGLTQTQFDHKMRTQQNLERRIEELLMPVIGAGKVIARVNADLDFSQRTIRREMFDPDKTVVRSENRNEESTQGRATIGGGVPDPNFRGDNPAGNMSDQNSSRESRTINFEINKEEQNIVSNSGDISRISVAVIVDGMYEKNAEGQMVFTPRSAEEMERIRQLVASAVGFDSVRGDTLEVSSIAFEGVDVADATPVSAVIMDYAMRFGKPFLNALLVFLFLIMVVRPVVLALIRPKVEGRMIEELEGLPQTDDRLALAEDTEDAVTATAMLDKIEDIKVHALHLSEQNMDQALGIIKRWLKDPKEEGHKTPARAA